MTTKERVVFLAALVLVPLVVIATMLLVEPPPKPPATAVAAQPTATQAPAATEAPAAPESPATATPAVAPTAAPAQAKGVVQAPPDVAAVFNKGGCGGCHTIAGVPGATGKVGPNLSNIGVDAATRKEGMSAEAYIRESILDPNAFIAPHCPSGTCPAGVMLQTFAETLSPEDLDLIVGYLVTLGTGQESTAPAETAPAQVALSDALPPEANLNPFAPLPKEPANEAMVALGKYLFFDKRLSNNNSLSCASCHQPDKAFTDGQALSKGYPSTAYFRNAPSVLNAVYRDYLYWDGRMDGNDIPTLVRDHITEAHFMSNDGRLMAERLIQVPEYAALFDKAFGGEPSFGKVLKAITAYVSTLNSAPVAYDQALQGDTSGFSEMELAGYELFTGKAECSSCHSGALLSDDKFYNTGVGTDPSLFDDPERYITFRRFFRTLGTPNYRNLREDVGRYALTLEDKDWAAFRTPSLREVARTAPYMHDGSLATLEDVVRFYNQGGGPGQTAGLKPLGLSDEEIAQLVAFLESLNSDLPPVEAPTLPDYGVLPLGDKEAAQAQASAPTPTPAPAAAEPQASGPSDVALAGFQKGGCAACHVIPNVPGASGQIGPNLTTVGAVAATRIEGMSARDYIHESIVDPSAFTAPDCPNGPCPAGVMPPNFADTLTAEEIDAIVDYLASLK